MSNYTFSNEIIPNLYIGSIEASENFDFIEKKNISVIINCSKDICNKFSINLLKPIESAPKDVQDWLYNNSFYIKYYRVPIDDSGKDNDIDEFYDHTIKLLPIIEKEYIDGKNILVHCLAGNQRSAAFICAFLMYHKKISLKDSIELILDKKPNVFFFGSKINFIDALNKLESYKDYNNYGFIMMRHVNSVKTNYYWLESYKNIRKYYNNKIIIIDDNSNYEYIKNYDIDIVNCDIIQSEFHGRGEILAYYYYYKYNFFKKAIILHDSVFINKHIDFDKYGDIKFLWNFKHDWDNTDSEISLLNNLSFNEDLKKKYYDKNSWHGCFGCQSVITYSFLDKLSNKYNMFILLNVITTRPKRMDFERILGLLCTIENNELSLSPSIFGIIHHYINWGYTFENYLTDRLNNKISNYDIIKVWSGR